MAESWLERLFLRLWPRREATPPPHPELPAFAYDRAELVWSGRLTRDEALAVIAERFPGLSRRQVAHALGEAMFESR
jgi:hypothetical protein